MLKTLAGLVLAAAAAFAIASPASAAPVCSDGEDHTWASGGTYADTTLYASNYCTSTNNDPMQIILVEDYLYDFDYNWDGSVSIHDIWGNETVKLTVTDGDGTDTFYVDIYRWYSCWWC